METTPCPVCGLESEEEPEAFSQNWHEWCVNHVIWNNIDGPVQQYIDGKKQVLGYLIGSVQKKMDCKGAPKLIAELLQETLKVYAEYYENTNETKH